MSLTQRLHRMALLLCLWGGTAAQAQPSLRPQSSPLRPAYTPRVAAPQTTNSVASLRLALLGAVRQPATYVCPPGTTVAQLLQATGGLTEEASGNLVVIRGSRFRGSHFFDRDEPESLPQYELLDGDVLIFHIQRGVRDAHYRWSTADQGTGVVQAPELAGSGAPLVSVACLGLTDHPVVLSLDPRQADARTLLVEMFQMTPPAAEQGVRWLLLSTNDGSLQNGTVLLFDSAVLGPNDVRPKFPLPQPLILPEPQATQPATAPVGLPSADTVPADPAAGDRVPEIRPGPGGGPAAVQPPVAPKAVTPVSDQMAVDGHLLKESLPGFPFVTSDKVALTDPVWSGAVDVGGGVSEVSAGPAVTPRSRPARPVEVLRGRQSMAAISPETSAGGKDSPLLPAGALTPATNVARGSEIARANGGGRETAPTAATSELETAWHEVDADGKAIRANDADVAAAGLRTWTIVGGVSIVSGLLITAGWLWWRERQAARLFASRTAADAGEIRPYAGPIKVASFGTAKVSGDGSIEELLDNRLTIEEQSLLTEPLPRLHGEVVGQRRLRVDAAHPGVAAPHFAVRETPEERRRAERLQRHLSVSVQRTRQRTAEPETGASREASMRSERATVQTVRYDIVQPESTATVSPAPQAATGSRKPGRSGDLLARVLESLREEA